MSLVFFTADFIHSDQPLNYLNRLTVYTVSIDRFTPLYAAVSRFTPLYAALRRFTSLYIVFNLAVDPGLGDVCKCPFLFFLFLFSRLLISLP